MTRYELMDDVIYSPGAGQRLSEGRTASEGPSRFSPGGFVSSELIVPPSPRAREEAGEAAPLTRRARFGAWLNRSRRILLLVWMMWIVGVFDFGYTLSEWGQAHFVEMNPLAVVLLSRSPVVVAWFKFGLLGLGSGILLMLRRHSIAEWASWFLFAVEVWLAARWLAYYDSLVTGQSNPMIEAF